MGRALLSSFYPDREKVYCLIGISFYRPGRTLKGHLFPSTGGNSGRTQGPSNILGITVAVVGVILFKGTLSWL